MSEPITNVGIAAHRVELHVALLAPGKRGPVTLTVPNEVRAVDRLRRKLERAVLGLVACYYEAGPCGYALQRQLDRGRVQGQVARRRWFRASRASGSRPTAGTPGSWRSRTGRDC